MRTIAVMLAFCVCADDWTVARDAAKAALKNPATAAREEAATKLAAFDRTESVELLVDLWAVSTGYTRQHQSDKQDRIHKMETSPVREKMQKGQTSFSGDEIKQMEDYKAAEKEAKEFEQKILAEDGVKAKIRAALAAMKQADSIKTLTSKLSENDWSIRAAAAEALAENGTPEAKDALRKAAARERDGRALVSIIDALGRQKDADSLPAIADALKKSADWQVRAAAVEAIRRIASPRGIEPLIDALKDAMGRLKDDINGALVALSGVDKHGDYATWKDWWQTNREALLAGTYPKPTGVIAKGDAGATTFYGIPVVSKRIVFVLDRSGSMAEPAEWKPDPAATPTGAGGTPPPPMKEMKGRKIDVAKFELRNAIWGLKEDVKFNVVFYNQAYTAWLEDGLELATKAAKQRAIDFIDKLEPEGQTNIFDPMEKGFLISETKAGAKKPDAEQNAFKGGVDTIYLLTDGMPNNGRIVEPQAIIAKIAEMNRTRKIVIHTIGVGKDARENFLRPLAEQNGGTCVMRR